MADARHARVVDSLELCGVHSTEFLPADRIYSLWTFETLQRQKRPPRCRNKRLITYEEDGAGSRFTTFPEKIFEILCVRAWTVARGGVVLAKQGQTTSVVV